MAPKFVGFVSSACSSRKRTCSEAAPHMLIDLSCTLNVCQKAIIDEVFYPLLTIVVTAILTQEFEILYILQMCGEKQQMGCLSSF